MIHSSLPFQQFLEMHSMLLSIKCNFPQPFTYYHSHTLSTKSNLILFSLKHAQVKNDFSFSVVEESTPPVITSDGSRYIPHHRIVHFDLKGAPPKLSYFKELFPVIREAGATAILLGKVQLFFTDLRKIFGNFPPKLIFFL